jgi:TPR repeat protein
VGALHWYRRGADLANPSAMTVLGVAFIEGRLTAKDEQAELRLLRLTADKGNPEAMRQLAFHMIAGDLVQKDAIEAERLLSKAAEVGHPPSTVDVGVLYDNRKNDADWRTAAISTMAKA